MNLQELKNIVEAALLASDTPLSVTRLQKLFGDDAPERDALRKVLELLASEYAERGIELKEVGSGFRIQVKQELAPWITKMYEEKPVRYSRALLETIALIAYRQPITRAGIEEIRGVSVSSNIIKTLLEREWVRVVGHRDVPGKPALYGTTKQFLDYFNLKSLSELPPLAEMRSIETIQQEFDLKLGEELQLAQGDQGQDQDQEQNQAEDQEQGEMQREDQRDDIPGEPHAEVAEAQPQQSVPDEAAAPAEASDAEPEQDQTPLRAQAVLASDHDEADQQQREEEAGDTADSGATVTVTA